jgi:type I restriction enzyme S subunit
VSAVHWEKARLSEIADLQLGKMLDAARHGTSERLPYLRNVNVRWFDVDLTDLLTMPFDHDEREKFGLREGDVLICEGGEPGRAAIWRGSNEELRFQKAIHRVRLSAAIHPEWLVCHLKADATSGKLAQYFSGTTIKHFTGVALSRYEVSIPPAREQRRIVAKVNAARSRVNAARAALEASKPLIAKYRHSILAAAFRGDLTADWRAKNPDVEPASALLDRMRDERRRDRVELGVPSTELGVPETWSVATLEEITDRRGIPYGIVQTGEQDVAGVPTVRGGDIKNFRIDVDRLKRVSRAVSDQYTRTILVGGEVLIAIRGTVGASAVVPPSMAGTNISREVAMIPIAFDISADYVCYYLGSPAAQHEILRDTKGVAQTGINLADLRKLVVPLPPRPEQEAVVAKIRNAFRHIDSVESVIAQQSEDLDALQSAILAKAVRGELVPHDPNDEPASVLLQRIRLERGKRNDIKPGATDVRDSALSRRAHISGGRRRRHTTVPMSSDGFAVADWTSASVVASTFGISESSSVDDVDAFYLRLRELERDGTIELQRVGDEDQIRNRA